MSFSTWLRYWKRSLERRSTLHQIRRPRRAASRLTRWLRLEILEDRTLLSGFTEFPVPTPSSFPGGITKAADGNIWFTEDNADKIARITPAGSVTEFAISAANNRPWDITAGPDGNVWFATEGDGVASQVGRITPSGTMTLFPILPASSYPTIATGPDGNLWVAEGNNNQIAVVSPQGALLEQFNIPISGGAAEYIRPGPDGNMWFTDSGYVGKVSVNGNFTIYSIPGTNDVKGIRTGPDGNFWFAVQDANEIGRLTPSGVLTEFAIPTPNSQPTDITVGPDGKLWFSEAATNQLARITTSGTITEFPIPTPNSGILSIATGADGNLWFTESNANQIGRFKLPGPQLTVNNLTVSGSNGAMVSNSGTYSDSFPGATVTLTASAGTVVQNNNGTWSWSETTPAGAAQTGPVTIYATDSNNQTAAVEFWLNVGQVFMVTNTGDNGGVNPAPGAGTGTLRQAIIDANNASTSGGPSLIAFAIPTSDPGYNPTTGAFTITPGGGLSNFTISKPVVLDGYTQPGASPNTLTIGDNAALKVQIDMSQFSAGGYGFILSGNASTVRGLVLNDVTAGSWAVSLAGTGDQASGNFIGTDVTGTSVVGGATQLASGGGIDIPWFSAPSPGDIIGGTTPDARNLISGFGTGISSNSTVVEGNYIGTDASGTKALGNQTGVSGGIIGGTAPGAGNLISGNQTGITSNGGSVIQGNLIGTDAAGTSALGNGLGIVADASTIGGNSITNPTARNVISGNGVGIEDRSSSTLIEGNYIGTDITGTQAVGNGTGVWLFGNTTLGGTDPGDGNVISGDSSFGVRIFGSKNVVQGNLIGTDYTGTKAVAGSTGIVMNDPDNLIGGLDTNAPGAPLAGGGNLLSGFDSGIASLSSGDVIEGNYIGTDITGTYVIGNGAAGVSLGQGASHDTIGGTTAAARNIISGNGYAGIAMVDYFGGPVGVNFPANNLVEGNYIGTDVFGSKALGNGYNNPGGGGGIELNGAINNTISGNLISGNGIPGSYGNGGIIAYSNNNPNAPNNGNIIQGNLIGTDATGTTSTGSDGKSLGNSQGVAFMDSFDDNNLIGGTTPGAGNIIAGNPRSGVGVSGTGNVIQGNAINHNGIDGVDVSGSNNTVGGLGAGAGNTIASNSIDGVFVFNGATGVSILGNSISASGGLGIHLDSAGNANDKQAAPVLISASTPSGSTTISGTLTSVANTSFRIEFFANQSPNPSSYGEGQTFLGFATVTTDGSGNASFTATGLAALPAGQNYVSATATNTSTGDTSQFAQDLLIAPTTTTLTSSPNPSFFGQSVTFTATVAATPSGAGTPPGSVVFVDTTTGVTLGTVALANGSATLTTSSLADGANTITAQYGGASTFGGAYGVVFLPSTGSLTQTVLPTILVLNPTAGGALSVSGNAGINIPGNLVVDSSSNKALTESGNASIKAASIQVVGGVSTSGNATLSPAAITGVNPVTDPLAGLTGPSTSGLTNYGVVSYSSGSYTLNPGIYTSIKASGKASLTLNPGVYLIEGGGLTVTGNASITGTGVMIYNTSSNYPSSTGSYGGITLSGNGTFTLSAPTSGPYAGIVIFQPSANTRAISLSGNAASGLTGTIYAPAALVYVGGNANVSGALVVNELSLSGNGASTQTAVGTNADNAGNTAGQLLAGDVNVYVNNSNGDLTSDELARIQDAVNAVDAVVSPYGVTVAEVSDPTQANVTLSMGTTSAAGNYGQGVLGCYTTAGAITLIHGWNWYAGADLTQIGANQYDFQTTVTHELGHALGLGESNVTTSAMYGTLAPGTTIRTLTTADLNIPYAEAGADAQRAALPPVSVPVSIPSNGQGMTASSSASIPISGSPLSGMEQIFADFALLVNNARNAHQSELSSVASMWQSIDALALQRLDALLSMQAGAMGLSKDTLMRDLFFASMSSLSS